MGINAVKRQGGSAAVLLALVAAVVAATLSLMAFTSTAYAGGGGSLQAIYKGTHESAVLAGAGAEANTLVYVSDAYKPITKATSSNKNVATVKVTKYAPQKKYKIPGYYTLSVTLKKPGTTKISFTYKGKKHVATFKVQKYVNPVKSFKVGSTECKSSLNAKKLFVNPRTGYVATLPVRNMKGQKVKITPASGWQVKSMYYGSKQVPGSVTKFKNGAKLTAYNFTVEMKNTKTGLVETFALQ